MALLILGLIALITGTALVRINDNFKRTGNPLRIAGIAFVIAGILSSCIVQVDAGQTGVKKLFGKIQPDVLGSGLHFINPLMKVIKVENLSKLLILPLKVEPCSR